MDTDPRLPKNWTIVYDYPPIPIRHMDWGVYDDDGMWWGHGPTREAAILDALDNIEGRCDE